MIASSLPLVLAKEPDATSPPDWIPPLRLRDGSVEAELETRVFCLTTLANRYLRHGVVLIPFEGPRSPQRHDLLLRHGLTIPEDHKIGRAHV